MSSAKKSVLANTAIITVIMLMSKVFGFMRESIIASTFGAGMETDAFYMSFGITGLLLSAIINLFSVVFLPIYSEIKLGKGRKEADEYASNIINIVILLSVSVSFIGFVFAPQIMGVLAPGFDAEKLKLTVKIVRVFFIFSTFSAAAGYLSSLLNGNERFAPPQLIGLPISLFGITACFFLSQRWGIISLAWAFGLAYLAQPVILFISLRGIYTHIPVLRLKDKNLRRTFMLGIPALATSLVAGVNTLVDRTLSSTLAEGSVASLRYADTLVVFASSIFIIPLATVLFTKLSEKSAMNDIDSIIETLNRGILFIVVVLTPITAITAIDATDIVRTAYARGQFDAAAVANTSTALLFYSLQFVFLGFSNLFNRTLIAVKDTKALMAAGILGMLLNIGLNLMLIRIWGIAGLALATSVSIAFTSGLQFIMVRRKLGRTGILKMSGQFIKIFIAAVLCAIVVFIIMKYTTFVKRPVFRFSLCALGGLGSYAIGLLLMKLDIAIEGLALVKSYVRRFLKRT